MASTSSTTGMAQREFGFDSFPSPCVSEERLQIEGLADGASMHVRSLRTDKDHPNASLLDGLTHQCSHQWFRKLQYLCSVS